MKRLLVFVMVLALLIACACSAEGAEPLAFGDKDAAVVLLQIDIASSLIVGYDENEMVVYIVSKDAEGAAFLENHDAASMLGEPIGATIGAIMLAAHEDAPEAGELDVAISRVDAQQLALDALMNIARDAAVLCNLDMKVKVEEDNEISYSAETGIAETIACATCNGAGVITCATCNGAGEHLVTIQQQKEVRNGYVCEVCGGKGWIDDGKHGGQKGNCDTCGGLEGKHGSADFRSKAYDLVMVDEEVMRLCENCNGSGETLCPTCSGATING